MYAAIGDLDLFFKIAAVVLGTLGVIRFLVVYCLVREIKNLLVQSKDLLALHSKLGTAQKGTRYVQSIAAQVDCSKVCRTDDGKDSSISTEES